MTWRAEQMIRDHDWGYCIDRDRWVRQLQAVAVQHPSIDFCRWVREYVAEVHASCWMGNLRDSRAMVIAQMIDHDEHEERMALREDSGQ